MPVKLAQPAAPANPNRRTVPRPQASPAADLLAWYERYARPLPWRIGPKERRRGVRPDPYRVWLSEVMLQQTTVKTVGPYFRTFVERWPTVTALASAEEGSVMAAWAGLGYYSRARNLIQCARAVAERPDAKFPETAAELAALPGIGAYTSAAIAAIAFDEAVAVVDGNVERVVARRFAIDTPFPRAKPLVRERLQPLVPEARAGEFAEALMDLGATLCTPRKPACVICPWSRDCLALHQGRQAALPSKTAKKRATDALRHDLRGAPRRRRDPASAPAVTRPSRRNERGSGERMGRDAKAARHAVRWRRNGPRSPERSSTASRISI